MAAVSTIIAGIGLGLAAGGSALQYKASQEAKVQGEENKKVNEEKQKMMELDATRRKREMIRQSIASRSASLATATAQGSAEGSGLQGAYGQIAGRLGVNTAGVDQNLESGRAIFASNQRSQDSMIRQNELNATGQGLSSVGGALVKNQKELFRLSQGIGSNVSKAWRLSQGHPLDFS
jgi:hypothetical protein